MIDEDEVREMLSRRAGTLPVMPLDTPAAVRRARRRLLVNGVTTVVAVAIVVTSFAGLGAIRSSSHPAHRPTPSATYPGHCAGLPPEGTKPSKPENDGGVIIQTNPAIGAGTGPNGRDGWNVFADGRVIGSGTLIPADANPLQMANSQRWLTPQGVQLLRSRILAIGRPVGLFKGNLELGRKAYDKKDIWDRYQVRIGRRSIYTAVMGPSSFNHARPKEWATADQMRALDQINTLITRLPASAWKDRISPYIPSHYCFAWDRAAPDPAKLPSPAREVLAAMLQSSRRAAGVLTIDQTRALFAALVQAGLKPTRNTPSEIDWPLPTADNLRAYYVSFLPGLPGGGC
jgi:hypothetical protein